MAAAQTQAAQTQGDVALDGRSVDFNDGWRFWLGNVPNGQSESLDDSDWQQVQVPHDWSIHLDFNLRSNGGATAGWLDGGVGWYRKTFTLPTSAAGKRITVDFDGVQTVSTVWVNGVEVGTNYYGYTAFSFDVTAALKAPGQPNVIALRAENPQPGSRWYAGSGLYRDVTLTATDPIYVDRDGTFVTTPNLASNYAQGKAVVNVKTRVKGLTSQTAAMLRTEILDASGAVIASDETAAADLAAEYTHEQNLTVAGPHLWSIEDPYLYRVVSSVRVDGQVLDRYETVTGLRWFDFAADDGFSLNGQWMKIKGVCLHHDLGALGAAVNRRATERQLEIMKSMGINSIRTSHNPASQVLIDLANRMGLTVMEEAFDTWDQGKNANDFHLYFNAHAESVIKAMVNRDKNAPSVIMWSIGNEVASPTGSVARSLNAWVKEVDTTRPTTLGDYRFAQAGSRAAWQEVDIPGLNYAKTADFATIRSLHPTNRVLGTESSSAIRSRGFYFTPDRTLIAGTHPDIRQASSYDNHLMNSFDTTASQTWKFVRDEKYVPGDYIWTGFDYIGEPLPYSETNPPLDAKETAKSSYFGIVDSAGFPKDIYYFYKAQYTDIPTVHLLPHWNWSRGQTVQVWAYSNAEEVELFLNGRSLGVREFEHKTTGYGLDYLETDNGKLYLQWDVPFEPGELRAVASTDGEVVAEDVVATAGLAAGLALTPDRRVIAPDGEDLSFITVDVVDASGTMVPSATNRIAFEVQGGTIAGVDNGNAISLERYQDTNQRRAFSGKALLIVASDGSGDPIRVTATSPGLASGTTTVHAMTADGDPELVELLPTAVTVVKGGQLTLPNTVTGVYSDSTEVELPVSWQGVDPARAAAIGQFDVTGNVAGTPLTATATVTVIDIAAVEAYSTVTAVGTFPILPSRIAVYYTDSSQAQADVTWDTILPGDLAVAGSVEVSGVVAGTALPAKAVIRVVVPGPSINIARTSGDPSVAVTASHTNIGDSLAHVNDGTIVYASSPKNRWTNWPDDGGTYRGPDDWIAFRWATPNPVDQIKIHFSGTTTGCVDGNTTTLGIELEGADGTVVPAANLVRSLVDTRPTNARIVTLTFDRALAQRVVLNVHNPATQPSCVAITEIEIPSVTVAANSTAELTDLRVAGSTVADFAPETGDYAIDLEWDAENPAVTATAADNARVTIVPAAGVPGIVRVMVVSENGLVQRNHTITLTRRKAPLGQVSLGVTGGGTMAEDTTAPLELTVTDLADAVLAPGEYTVAYSTSDPAVIRLDGSTVLAVGPGQAKVKATVTYLGVTDDSNEVTLAVTEADPPKVLTGFGPVGLKVPLGQAPALPARVTATYDRGLARELPVVWDAIDPAAYGSINVFTVAGTVAGTGLKPVARIEAVGVIAVQNVATATIVGEPPRLPERVTVYYSDGTDQPLPVTWGAVNVELPGVVNVQGKVDGVSGFSARAAVRVSGTYINNGGRDVSSFRNGYTLPALEASYTFTDDRLVHINDGIVSYTNSPKNRWTNWTPDTQKRASDWIDFTFGMETETAYYIDEVKIYWVLDQWASVPNLTLQAWDGSGWVAVTGQAAQTVSSSTSGAEVVYTFDKTATSRLRLAMDAIPRADQYLYRTMMITEVQIFTDGLIASSAAQLSNIFIDGVSLPEVDPGVADYTWYSTAVPEVTASAGDNASVTVVPAIGLDGVTRVIVTSEDGAVTTAYRLHLPAGAAVTGVDVDPSALTLDVGAQAPMAAVVEPADRTDKNGQVAWSSSDSAVATVSPDGTVVAVRPGQATVTATTWDGGFTDSVSVTVRDPGALHGLLQVAETMLGLGAGVYTSDSLDQLSQAILAAEAVLESDGGQSAIDAALGSVQAALNGLTLATQTGALATLVAALDAAGPIQGNYTAASWAPYAAALAQARGLLASGSDPAQSDVDDAVTALRGAINALVVEVRLEAVRALVDAIDTAGPVRADYTAASWDPFWAALLAARDVLAPGAGPSQGEANLAQSSLLAAWTGLVHKAPTRDLAGLVAAAETMELNQVAFTPPSWSAYAAALAAANGILDQAEPSADAIRGAANALSAALSGLVPAVDATALTTLVGIADGLAAQKSLYTAGSWQAVDQAAAAARAVAGERANQAVIDRAAIRLRTALAGLRIAPTLPVADTGPVRTILTGLIASTADLTAATYTPASWLVLATALAQAKTAASNPDASLAQIQAASAELSHALAGLVPAASETGKPTDVDTVPDTSVFKVKTAQRSVVLAKGSSATIPAGAYLADGSKASIKATWTTSNAKVARVTATGKVTARAVGKTTITVKAGTRTAKISVRVVAKTKPAVKVARVKATGIPRTMAIGKVAWATGTYTPASATAAKIRYASSNPKVATIDKNGVIKTLKKGNTKITVRAGAKTKTYTIKVR
jgi:beta-galactosidase